MPKPAEILDSPPERAIMNADMWRGRLAGMSSATQTDLLLDLLDAELTRSVGATDSDGGARGNRHAPWRRLGIYRHTADRLREGLTRAVGLRLPATVFFDQPTPASLVAHLLRELLGVDEQAHIPAAQGLTTAVGADSIAIVGMACRLPGGIDSPEALWAMVREGREALGGLPDDRGWDLAGLYNPDPDNPGTSYTRHGGFLPGIDRFDAGFFGISPREAGAVDPQQRLMLEISWEALERAGLDPRTLRGSRTGVFTGVSLQDYGPAWAQAPQDMQGQMLTGNASGIIAGRVSYTFGFEGPALCVDTQCSASLVAVHLAGQSLRTGESDLALAGGVTVMSSPGMLIEFSRKRGLAADGRCKAFGADADGTGWADGATVLLLERLSDARRNNHPVLALVRGSAVNADGATNGMTAPNGNSQQRLIRQALANAGLRPADVDAVEAHGTGTVLGDPIEAQAIQATYGRSRPARRPLYLGSLKSNIGHAMAAAGVAGVIKSVQALAGETLPATLHVEEPTPHVDWSEGTVHLLTDPVPWPRQTGRTRRIAVSAFGISGTNAHLILEEAPHGPLDQLPRPRPARAGSPSADPLATHLATDTASADLPPPDLDVLPRDTFSGEAAAPLPMVLSGRTGGALRAAAGRLRDHLAGDPGLDLADMAFSLAGRSRFEHRATIVIGAEAPHERLAKALSALAAGRAARGLAQGTVRAAVAQGRLALLFTGQGSQRPGMGRDLYDAYPVFAEALDEICTRFDPHLDRPLRRVMFAAAPDDAEALSRTEYTQPALFAFETALFRLVTAWGLTPGLLAGHSIGELVAAHVAGVWTLDDAVTMVSARGRLMQSCRPGGAMISIRAGAEAVAASLDGLAGQVEIATVNGPEATVIAGDADLAERVAAGWQERGIATRRLTVSHAFHSPHMDDMLAEFREIAAGVAYQEPTIPIVSTLTGRLDPAELITPEHWVRHVRQPVRFDVGARSLRAAGAGAYLELGPDAVLTALLPACLAAGDATTDAADAAGAGGADGADGAGDAPTTTPGGGLGDGEAPVAAAATRGPRPEAEALLSALAELDVHGVAVDWRAAGAGAGRLVERPTYPFPRRRHWLDPAVTIPAPRGGGRPGADDPAGWCYRTVWRPLPDAAHTAAVSAQAAVPPPLSGAWPVLVPAAGLDEATLTRLTWLIARLGGQPVTGRLGGAAADRARLAPLLAAAAPDPAVPIGAVVSLLGLDTTAHADHPALTTGFALTVALAQALGDADVAAPLWLVTRGAVSTGAQDPVTSPEQAMLWGLGRTLALERPRGFGGLLDLPTELDDESLGWFATALTAPGGEDQVAARTANLFVPRLVRAGKAGPDHAGDATPAHTDGVGGAGTAVAWHPGSTVLITGGTGALGARTARHLAARGVERLVLAGRRGGGAAGGGARGAARGAPG
ncbi:type I polyketide synthase, partial [Frankia sp. AgB32]|uniref:type I polyketide synthase n=1 Tax=Frankia sp. AgB32 TaxID=631119 RepID=UPI00200FE180